MNERIRELAEQAKFQLDQDIKDGKKDWKNTPQSYDEMVQVKFAELIVSECVMLCDKVYEQNDNVKIQAGATFCREDIKKHFGVEE